MLLRISVCFLFCIALGGQTALSQSEAQTHRDQAAEFYKAGRFEEAVAAFKVAVELEPGNLKTWKDLGWAYHRLGQSDLTISTWTRILKIEPNDVSLLNALGSVYADTERWTEAVSALTRSLELAREQPDIWLLLGGIYQSVGATERAMEAYRTSISMVQDAETRFRATTKLADMYHVAGREVEAQELLSKSTRELPEYEWRFRDQRARLLIRTGDAAVQRASLETAEFNYNAAKNVGTPALQVIADARLSSVEWKRGDEAYRAERYEEAELAYETALEIKPDNARLFANLGWSQRKSGKIREAIQTWEGGLANSAGDTTLFHHIADAYMELGERSPAMDWYAKAWTAGTRDSSIPFRLAEFGLESQNTEIARQWLDQLLTLPDLEPRWGLRIANLFLRHEQADLGMDFLQQLSGSRPPEFINPALSQIYTHQASTLYENADYAQAIELYRKALELNAENRLALKNIGWSHWRLEQWDQSEQVWTRYAELAPYEAEPAGLLARLHLQREFLPRAVEAARASLELDPEQPAVALVLARALFANEEFAEARGLTKSLTEQFPDDVAILRFYGEILMQYEDFGLGRRVWERLMALSSLSERTYYYWIRSLYETGEYDLALTKAREAAGGPMESEPLYRMLVDDALLKSDLPAAARWYEQWSARFPERMAPALQLADLYRQMEALDKSQAVLLRLQAMFPEDPAVTAALADVERASGNTERARDLDYGLLAKHPSFKDAYVGSVGSLIAEQRHPEVLAKLAANRPYFWKDYEVEQQRARVLASTGDASGAIAAVSRIAGSDPSIHFVPSLLYHGIARHSRSTNLYVQRFRDQMLALRNAGFHTITVGELALIREGRLQMPSKPILITFDDARIDSFVMADPILKELNMKVTMFVPTGKVVNDHPFFADWDMIRQYYATGRWDVQPHGHEAHDPVELDAAKTPGLFLVNRRWLTAENRLETRDEFYRRVEDDHKLNVHVLRQHLPGLKIAGYSYPLSEAGHLTMGNIPEAADINQELLTKHFQFGFIQDPDGYNRVDLSDRRPSLMRRLAVPSDWDGAQLVQHLRMKHPPNRTRFDIAKWLYWNGNYASSQSQFELAVRDEPLFQTEADYYLGAISSQGGQYKSAAQVLETSMVTSEELRPQKEALLTRLNWLTRPVVGVDERYSWDSSGRTHSSTGVTAIFPLNAPIDISFRAAAVQFNESRRQIHLRAREAGLEFGFGRGQWPLSLETGIRYRDVTRGAEDSLNGRIQATYNSLLQNVQFQWSFDDIDTAQARQADVQASRYFYSHVLRLSKQWDASISSAYQMYNDDNIRTDATASLQYRLPAWNSLRVGALFGHSDSRFQSNAYYTPETLRMGQALISIQHRWESDWAVNLSTRFGHSEDRLRGGRILGSGTLRMNQKWGSRLRSNFDLSYSSAPGYRAFSLLGHLEFLMY